MTWKNPFNRTQPYVSDLTVGDSAFGKVFAGGGGKTLQLDARIEFYGGPGLMTVIEALVTVRDRSF
jgi:hypothetical protein